MPLTAARAATTCSAWFSESVEIETLYGEFDQNFRVTAAGGERFVLKVMRDASEETRSLVGLQVAMLSHIAERQLEIECPRPVRTRSGKMTIDLPGPSATEHVVWVLTYIDGELLDDVETYRDALLSDIGRAVATVDRALLDFSDPRADRELLWDVAGAARQRQLTRFVPDANRRAIVEHFLERFEDVVQPALRTRPRSVIHNDGGNQHNMILGASPDSGPRVRGIIDFGDALATHTICGLGVAAAYATFGRVDAVEAVARVARGYHAVLPLEDADLELALWLAATRLTVSVCVAAMRAAENPQDSYAAVSAKPAWRVLEQLFDTDFVAAHGKIREIVHA